jgi:protein involved in polysaccharide export with SLBB domain
VTSHTSRRCVEPTRHIGGVAPSRRVRIRISIQDPPRLVPNLPVPSVMTQGIKTLRPVLVAFALAATVGSNEAAAQASPTPAIVPIESGSLVRTREELEGLLVYYEQVLLSPAYSAEMRESTQARADLVRQRLTLGDFRLGDGVALTVRGATDLPDTVYVQSGPKIDLDLFGEVDLAGVLRSELEETIQEALAVTIRDPVVQAIALLRISVQGAVGQPGFFVVPADMLVSSTLMVAGGPAATADIGDLRIQRGADVVIGGDELQEALRLGRTLDQLNLQAGDQVFVPAEAQGSTMQNLAVVFGLVTSVTFLIINLAN